MLVVTITGLPWRAILPSEAVVCRKIAVSPPALMLDAHNGLGHHARAAYAYSASGPMFDSPEADAVAEVLARLESQR